MHRRALLLALLWSPAASASAQDARAPLTAELAADLALARSPALRAARARARAAEAEARLESRPEDPRLTATDHSGPGGRHEELTLSFDLWSLIGFSSRRRAGRAERSRAEAELAERALALATGAKAAFYEVQAASATFALRRARADSARALADYVAAERVAGNVAELDVDRAAADAEEAALGTDLAAARLDAARAALSRAMGVPPAADWGAVGEPAPPAETEPDAAALAALARDRRPLRAEALAQARAARAALFDRENRAFGAFRGGVDYEREIGGQRLVGPSLELDVPATGRGALGWERARAEADAADADADALDAELDEELAALVSRLSSAARRARRLADGVVPRRAAVVAEARTRAGAMLSSLRDLLAAQDAETSARLELVEARRDYWTARAALERAVGGSLDGKEGRP
jgi:cobalt-zinc-cadmium efflux system outer membrane protein